MKTFSGMIYNRKIALALWACLLPGMAMAANGKVPVASGAVIQDTARITFEWPKEVEITAARRGNRLSVTFNRKADPDFADVLKQLYPYVMSAERKADGKTIVFTLDKPYAIRTFASESINGVELLQVDAGARPDTAQAQKTETLAALSPAAGEEAAATPAPEPAATPQDATAAPPVAESVAAPPPEPTLAPAPASPESTAVPESTPVPASEAQPAPDPAATVTPTPLPSPEAAEPSDGNPGTAEALPVRTDQVKVSVSAASDNVVLRLPFPERTAVAAFIRARALWVVWVKPLAPDLSDFEELPRTVIGKAEILPVEGATVLRMPVDDGVFVSVAKEDNTFNWAVLVTPKKRELAKPLTLEVNTDPPVPAHVFVPALETADPITVTDPQVGDRMVITPFYSVSEGLLIPRDFVQFTLLDTAQGLAVVKKADDTEVTILRNGLRVSVPQGAVLTPGLPGLDREKIAEALQQTVTLFPYEFWKSDPENQKKQMRGLLHRIVESENPQEANEARLRMAQIYLSQGMAAEAMGFLDGIRRTNPAYFRSSKLNALRGAANFLMYRFVDASRDFGAAELNNNKEIDYWRGMLADLLGNPDQNYDYLGLNNDYISKYPPIFRQRLAIVAADRSISSKDYHNALKIFDTLTQDNLIDPISHYVHFLMAKISAETGQEKEAIETWDKLAVAYEHPFVQSRAEFSRILWDMEHNTLPKDKAIDRLERLRLSWHGDSLELNILTMLGDLYSEQRDYVNAMRIWHGGVMSFPNTSTAIDMARKMQETFITMFNEGLAESLPPLEALALYYEYRNYTPTGNTGNAIINRLSERLVSVDLLEQAAGLLEHQMRFQAEKEKRSETGARLATIYLLNHQPAKALQTLQDSVYGDNPLMLRLLRNRLTAEAMIELGQMDKALQTLGQDNSQEAERLRITIHWKEKDWPRLISSIENILKTRKDITAPITVEESEYLMRLALAYVFQNDRVQLRYLQDYFGPLMASNPNREMFEFITSGDIPLTTTNFDEVLKNIADTRSFIENYSARMAAMSEEKVVSN